MTTSGTINDNEWYNEWQRVATNDNESQQTTASRTTNENNTVHF